MHDIYLVFYEGDTEGEYISLLKRLFRSSVKIKAIKEGTRISKSRVTKAIDSIKLDRNDNITTFLMYDEDVQSINNKLNEIPGIKLMSNPCFELWYLLHMTSQVGYMSSDECCRRLKQIGEPWSAYEKGTLSDSQKQFLWGNKYLACNNARKLPAGKNPSCTVYELIEKL